MVYHQQLFWVKLIHTGIWIFFNVILVYLFYAVLTDSVDYKFWIGIGFIGLECLVLLFNRWSCPLETVLKPPTGRKGPSISAYASAIFSAIGKAMPSKISVAYTKNLDLSCLPGRQGLPGGQAGRLGSGFKTVS